MTATTLNRPSGVLEQTTEPLRALPALAQVLLLVALFVGIKTTPGLPYAGQIAMGFAIIATTFMIRRNGQSWRDFGLRWATNWRDLAKGAGMVVLVFVGAISVNGLIQAAYAALYGVPLERTLPDVSTLPLYLTMMALIWTTNSFGEEMVFRGFMMSRLSTVFGGTKLAWILAAFAQAIIFGLGHAYQGIAGIIITGLVGLVFGLCYLLAKRNLWPLIIAHGIINSVGMTFLHLQATGAIPPA